ncbi:MAG TPA: hypothetical protein DDW73_09810 [Rhizobium sp.]|nr:hypothetical protein [Rhizobium sp.]
MDFQMSMAPSIGMVMFESDAILPDNVLRSMQSAVQGARESDTRIGFFSPALDLRHHCNFIILQDFRAALSASYQLSLVFQPRMDVSTGDVGRAEALLRWDQPELGPISPVEFIPVIEASPLAWDLTDWVINAALSNIALMGRNGLKFKLSINISALNLQEQDFFTRLITKLSEQHIDPHQIELELTETAIMKETENAFGVLNQLKSAGVQLAIDDFGTGYAALPICKNCPQT